MTLHSADQGHHGPGPIQLASSRCELRQPLARGGLGWAAIALATVLAGCQALGAALGLTEQIGQAGLPSGMSEPPRDTAAARAVLPSVPPCKAGVAATLISGLRVRNNGADRQDPQVCLVSWKGRTHRYFAGFWGSGRFRKGALPEREAIRRAMTGPVGSRTSFDDTRADMWGEVTVEHVANPMLVLRDGPRRTIQLRVVRRDVRGRPNVCRVALHWIDV